MNIKKILLEFTAKLSLPHNAKEKEIKERIEHLKIIARVAVNELCKETITLSAQEEEWKKQAIEKREEKKKKPKKRYIMHNSSFDRNFVVEYLTAFEREFTQQRMPDENIESLAENKKKVEEVNQILDKLPLAKNIVQGTCKSLSPFHEVWKNIYTLIEFPENGNSPRDKYSMFQIVKAILYQAENQCSWAWLPQDLASSGEVCFYKKLWENEGILDKILTIASTSITSKNVLEKF